MERIHTNKDLFLFKIISPNPVLLIQINYREKNCL